MSYYYRKYNEMETVENIRQSCVLHARVAELDVICIGILCFGRDCPFYLQVSARAGNKAKNRGERLFQWSDQCRWKFDEHFNIKLAKTVHKNMRYFLTRTMVVCDKERQETMKCTNNLRNTEINRKIKENGFKYNIKTAFIIVHTEHEEL